MPQRRNERWYAERAMERARMETIAGDDIERDKHISIARKALVSTGLGFPRVSTLLHAHGYSYGGPSEQDTDPLHRLTHSLREIAAKTKSQRVVYLGDHGDNPWFTLRFIPEHDEGRRRASTSHVMVRDGVHRSVAVYVDAPVVIADSGNVPKAYGPDKNIIGLGHIALDTDPSRACIDHPVALYVPESIVGKKTVQEWARSVVAEEATGPEWQFAERIANLRDQDWPVSA